MLAQLNFDAINQEAGAPFDGLKIRSPLWLVSLTLRYVFGAAGIILLFMLLSSGYQMIFSKGDPKAMEAAKSRITTSIIGIVILFASFWIVQIVFQMLGVNFQSEPLIR